MRGRQVRESARVRSRFRPAWSGLAAGVYHGCTSSHTIRAHPTTPKDGGRARRHYVSVVWGGVLHGVRGTPKQGVAGSIPAGGITIPPSTASRRRPRGIPDQQACPTILMCGGAVVMEVASQSACSLVLTPLARGRVRLERVATSQGNGEGDLGDDGQAHLKFLGGAISALADQVRAVRLDGTSACRLASHSMTLGSLRISAVVSLLLVPLLAHASNAVRVLAPATSVCGRTGGLEDIWSAAVSPDGAHLYAASTRGTIAVFTRDAASGRLSQVEVVDVGMSLLPVRLAISADGQNLYLPTGGSVTVFDRDALTGHLDVLEVQSPVGFFGATAVTVSPDGNQVYAAGDGSVAVFTRTPATGALAFAQMLQDGVGGVDGLSHARDAVVTSDGAHLYVASVNDDAIAIFARDAGTGLLTFVGTEGSGQAWRIVPSPDGAFLYVTSASRYLSTFARNAMTGLLAFLDSHYVGGAALAISGDGRSLYHYLDPSRLALEDRDPGTGGAHAGAEHRRIRRPPDERHRRLARRRARVCIQQRRWDVRSRGLRTRRRDGDLSFVEAQLAGGFDDRGLAITPDGEHLYVACAHRSSVVELVRDSGSGAVSVAGVQHDGVAGVDGLQGARAVAVSPDGAHVYVASADEPLHQQSALVAFARDAGSGVLSFIEVERAGAGGVPSLEAVNSLAVAPDGAHVYTGAYRAITVFARNAATGALDFASAVTEAPGGAELYGVSGVAVSPDAAHLYALTVDRLHVFARDAGTGVLTPVETEQGFAEGVSIAISPDGRTVYVGARMTARCGRTTATLPPGGWSFCTRAS